MERTENFLPEKEPIQFEVNLEGLCEEESKLVENIQKTAQKILYHWKTFPIILPSSLYSKPDGETSRKKGLPKDLFIAPTFDELDVVALNVKGEQRKLTKKQLSDIRNNGEFEVDSVNFRGQIHRWKLSQLLQKGTRPTHNTLLKDLALAVSLFVITSKNRFHSSFFSLSQSISKFVEGFLRLVDLLIGVPSLKSNALQAKLREERSKYLVAELVVAPHLEDDLDNLCLFVKQQIRKQTMEKYAIENEALPKVPYLYLNPKGTEIDLRLFDRNVIKRVLPVVASIVERESKGWFHHFREKMISELKSKKLSEEEIERLANVAIMDEFMERISNGILNDDKLRDADNVGMILVHHAWSVILMHRAVENVHIKLYDAQNTLRETLKQRYPILSLINPWMRNKMNKKRAKFMALHNWSAHEEALNLCRSKQLHRAAYFLYRDLTFMREREPVLLKELSRVKTPTTVFHWRTQIWSPQSWKITRVFQGQTEVIPTVITHNTTSITNPRSDPNQPVFLVEKQITRTTSTRWPFWRWINYCHRTWSWIWNAMFLFGVVIPWCSPVSLRALFFKTPFMPDLELSQINGTLFPHKSSLTQTLYSRLLVLWRHISKSRTEFESQPDTGFIGKGFTRHVNRVWNYVCKGVLGTLGIVLIFPIVCLLSSFFSLLIAVTSPLWMPLITLIFHLSFFFYDYDSPDESQNRFVVVLESLIWMILIQGCVQPILAVVVACLICPVLAIFIIVFAVIRYTSRMIWDGIMYHAVVKKKGRIPAGDSFIVKRIEGPGLSSKFYYQIKPEQALSAFESKLEVEELLAFKDEMKNLILTPQKNFRDFVDQVFTPFSAILTKTGTYAELEKEGNNLIMMLDDRVAIRKRDLQTGLSAAVRSKIKMTMNELKLTIKHAADMLEKLYPEHVSKWIQTDESEFWEAKGLATRDWIGFVCIIFSDIFAPEFLTPLEETDTFFKLEVQHLDLSRFVAMVRSASFDDDMDVVKAVHIPKGNIHVAQPYIDMTTFNPRGRMGASVHKVEHKKSRKPWKKTESKYGSGEKLMIPIPLPHPCHIAIIIYNREHEDPIPMESEACQNVLKVIEESASTIKGQTSEYINMDVGSTDSQSQASLSASHDTEDNVVAEPGISEDSSSYFRTQLSHSVSRDSDDSCVLNLHAVHDDVNLDTDRSHSLFRSQSETNV